MELFGHLYIFQIYFCWGMPNLEREIECDVHGLRHSCVLPNHQFYFYILAVSSALLCVYILCNLYNLVWIVCPQLGTMYRIVKKYQEHSDSSSNSSPTAAAAAASNHSSNSKRERRPCISTANFLSVYFDRRHKDLKLLLNLLAETSGLPESFRILTLFDKKFQSLWKPQNLRFEEYETVIPGPPQGKGLAAKSHSIVVRWNDAPIGHFLTNYDSSLSFEYTIDINPGPLNELGLKSVLYKKDNASSSKAMTRSGTNDGGSGTNFMGNNAVGAESFHLLESGSTVKQPHTVGCPRRASEAAASTSEVIKYRYEVVFDNIISEEEEYTVTISTELNGRTVTQMVEKFPVGSPPSPAGAASVAPEDVAVAVVTTTEQPAASSATSKC